MLYETIEANARILANTFTRINPPHIFIGDTNHYGIVTTMSCMSHPLVLSALKTLGKNPICVEIAPTFAEKFFKENRKDAYFQGMSHEHAVAEAYEIQEANPEYTSQVAFDLLVNSCDENGIEVKGVDTHQESITREEYDAICEIGIEQFTLMQSIQANLGGKALNLEVASNDDLKKVWRDVVKNTDPDSSPEDRKIRATRSLI